MTPAEEEYEREYDAALRAIRARAHVVGEPYRSHDGIRAVRINDFPCTDEIVFEKAWGDEIAKRIMEDKPR